jgi:hypothetical protein
MGQYVRHSCGYAGYAKKSYPSWAVGYLSGV